MTLWTSGTLNHVTADGLEAINMLLFPSKNKLLQMEDTDRENTGRSKRRMMDEGIRRPLLLYSSIFLNKLLQKTLRICSHLQEDLIFEVLFANNMVLASLLHFHISTLINQRSRCQRYRFSRAFKFHTWRNRQTCHVSVTSEWSPRSSLCKRLTYALLIYSLSYHWMFF